MQSYQEQTLNKAERQVIRAGDSEGFEIFKDQQFTKQKRQESQLLNNKHKGLESLNMLTVTHLRQSQCPKKAYSVFHKDKELLQEGKKTHRRLKVNQTADDVREFTLNPGLQNQTNPNPKARYTRASQSEIKLSDTSIIQENQQKQSNNKITILKRIIEHYNHRLFYDDLESNLINKVSVNNTSSLSCKNKVMTINKIPPKSAQKDSVIAVSSKKNNRIRLKTKSNSKATDFFDHYFDQSTILVEAQGLNQLIRNKQEDRKKINKSVNEGDLIRQKYQRKVSFNPPSTKKPTPKFETLPTEKPRPFDNSAIQTSINTKVTKYKQFLFLVNYANKIYRQLDFTKYEIGFKVYVGRGNNSNLIKALMKRRFWFQVTKNIEEAHFVWTQLKEERVYERQNEVYERRMQKICEKECKIEELKEESKEFNQEITETKHTMSEQVTPEVQLQERNITLDRNSPKKEQRDPRRRKMQERNINLYNPESKLLTKQQLKNQRQMMTELSHKKKVLFQDRLPFLKHFKVAHICDLKDEIAHNHLPVNGLLGNKKAMFYMLRQYYNLTGKDVFEIVPLTYHIKKGTCDEQYKSFMNKFIQNRLSGKSNYWIVKPGEFSNRGQGITCSCRLEEIKGRINKLKGKHNRSLIVQKYLTNPLLYNGRKFDIRTYMLLTVNNRKLRGYWYQDGYIRTSSYQWTLEQIGDTEIHLTNDAIQKYCHNYGKYEPGNKLTYSQLQRYLDSLPRPVNTNSCNFMKDIYPKIKDIAADAIKSAFCFIDPERKGNNFELFGLDFMIDSEFKPWLIQINTNPCLEMSCPVLNRIVPSLVENVFRIGVDPLIPPPLNYSSTHKYTIPENATHYNKFQLIFDQERDSPSILALYKDNQVVKMIDEYEQDKQTYEQEGQQLILDDVI